MMRPRAQTRHTCATLTASGLDARGRGSAIIPEMAEPHVFIVKPRRDGGCDLTGPLLPYVLRYQDEAAAGRFRKECAGQFRRDRK